MIAAADRRGRMRRFPSLGSGARAICSARQFLVSTALAAAGGRLMSRFACTTVAIVCCTAATAARAHQELDLAGLASGIPLESSRFGLRSYPISTAVTNAFMSRLVDSHSPGIANAALLGTIFPTATV